MPLVLLQSPKGVPGTGLRHSPREGGWGICGAAALCGEGVVLWSLMNIVFSEKSQTARGWKPLLTEHVLK